MSTSTVRELKAAKRKKKTDNKKWREMKLMKQMKKVRAMDQYHSVAPALKMNHDRPIGNKYKKHFTLSIAVPGSILNNAQSTELRSYLAGQIARAAVIFCVDEVIVYNDHVIVSDDDHPPCDRQLARILQYLECPQYLRKQYFPQHMDLKYAGLLNPLDCPHHMRVDDVCEYREGCVLNKPVSGGNGSHGSYVNCGMRKEVRVDRQLEPGIRCTVRIRNPHRITGSGKKMRGEVVSPRTPVECGGLYWGYSVRLAESLSTVFTGCPYTDTDTGGGGYDVTIGTSDKGQKVDDMQLPHIYTHVLVVFGGIDGLESALECDVSLATVSQVSSLFHYYINTCPNQGSRTIRTEEAVLLSLSAITSKLVKS